jgi:hypothetical protein
MEGLFDVAIAVGFVLAGLGLAVLSGILLYKGTPRPKTETQKSYMTDMEAESA